MKYLLVLAALVLVGTALVGCGSGDTAPTETTDQLAEMKKSVPAGTPSVPPEMATEGMQVMGGNKKGK